MVGWVVGWGGFQVSTMSNPTKLLLQLLWVELSYVWFWQYIKLHRWEPILCMSELPTENLPFSKKSYQLLCYFFGAVQFSGDCPGYSLNAYSSLERLFLPSKSFLFLVHSFIYKKYYVYPFVLQEHDLKEHEAQNVKKIRTFVRTLTRLKILGK